MAEHRAERGWTVADHLRDAPPEHVELYRRLEAVIHGLGEVTVSVSRTTITFKGSRRGSAPRWTWTTSSPPGCARATGSDKATT